MDDGAGRLVHFVDDDPARTLLIGTADAAVKVQLRQGPPAAAVIWYLYLVQTAKVTPQAV